MRGFCLIFACVMLGGVTACGAAPKVDRTPVTSSPLPSMQKYNGYVGKDYWITALLRLCEGPSSLHCSQFLKPGTHLKVVGLVPNHSEVAGTSIDDPYFHVVMDGGRSGFVSAVIMFYVNAKMRETGKYEQYVYGGNKSVHLRNGIVISVSVKGRDHNPDELQR